MGVERSRLASGLEGGADGPEDEGEPDEGDVFGQAGSDVDFDQPVGDENVCHGGDEAGVAAQPGTDVAVHRQPGGDDRRAKQQLDRLGVAQTDELHQQRAQERRQRPIDQEEGIAIAKGELRRPAGQPVAVVHDPQILKDEIDIVPRVVRAPEIARLKQGHGGEGGEQDHQNEMGRSRSACAATSWFLRREVGHGATSGRGEQDLRNGTDRSRRLAVRPSV